MRGRTEKPLTKSITAKVTEAEEIKLRERAAEQGLTLSEWSRKTLLQAADFPSAERIILEETQYLRFLLLTVYGHLKGVTTPEGATALKNSLNPSIDSQKQTMANQRIFEASQRQIPVKETAA